MARSPIKISTSQRPASQKQRLFARSSGASFDVRAAGTATVIEFYDEVGAYGISAKAFSDKLKAAGGCNILLKINSPGGDVFDGIAIHNDLVAHAGKVRVEITGVAASAASIIAMAGHEIAIAENAFVMIHDSWGLTVGNRHDHAETEDLLAQIDQALAATYAARTGLSVADCASMMDDETWLAGADAKAKGFADEILGSADIAAKFDLSLYAHAPAGLSHRAEGATNLNSPVELEKLLRNAGLSRRQAKAVSFNGWQGLAGTTEASEISGLAARIAAATKSIERITK
ncbi:head maturation protease, ClpP-related [Bradyrhizobium lablabi]|uniref:head maturation protease, ClpP-related n=1 Tax=Bradyrhizobium lablabi TaxID=722472 RepID=UPI00090B8767|nr:head maturation protease, ClpP-related [Bradyrhizobium lablabi]SHM37238.1 ATP-dependent protease ClpP, protease subunit [Bradyrhizobium lablabi]